LDSPSESYAAAYYEQERGLLICLWLRKNANNPFVGKVYPFSPVSLLSVERRGINLQMLTTMNRNWAISEQKA
jgi:hypothetical protein